MLWNTNLIATTFFFSLFLGSLSDLQLRNPCYWHKVHLSCESPFFHGDSFRFFIWTPDYQGKQKHFPVSLRTTRGYMMSFWTMGYEGNGVCNFQEVILKEELSLLPFLLHCFSPSSCLEGRYDG